MLIQKNNNCFETMVYLNRFCCCWSARFGSIIIGWISIIFSSSNLLAILIALVEKPFLKLLLTELVRDLEQRYEDGLITNDTYKKEHFYYTNILTFMPYVLITGLILDVISILTNTLLLIGVSRKNSVILLPWLVYTIFQLGIVFGYTIGFSIFSMSSGDTSLGVLNLFISLMATGIGIYFWIIVYSVRRDIRRISV